MVDMNKINVIPKPKSIKLNEHGLNINLLDKIITTKNSDSEIKIAKMVQDLLSPIKKLINIAEKINEIRIKLFEFE